MPTSQFYRLREAEFQQKLQHLKHFNLLFILLKIAFFCAFLVLLYHWMVNGMSLLWPLGDAILFAVVFKLDQRFMKHLRLQEALVQINRAEAMAMEGDHSSFDDGIRYVNHDHPYSFDLDLYGKGSLYQFLNRTITQEGAQELSRCLDEICTDPDEILNRQTAVKDLSPRVEWRQMFVAQGYGCKLSLVGLESHLSSVSADMTSDRPWKKGLVWGFIALTLMSVLVSAFGIIAYQLPLILILTQLLFWGITLKSTNDIHRQIESFHKVFEGYNDLLVHLKNVDVPFESTKLQCIQQQLTSSHSGAIEAFYELGKILASFNQRSNWLVAMVFNGLIMRDVLLVMKYQKWVHQWHSSFPQWRQAVAELDALLSLANYAYNHPNYCIPQISQEVVMETREMGHPLIDASVLVNNDFSVSSMQHFHLVTGANMAGKSTFLRTVGVNLILASCGAPVCATSFGFKPLKLFSSMRTSDNLVNHTSYFQAELLRLKQLIDTASTGEGLFVILDEILKGTNSRDKLAGSRLFLLKMLEYNAAGLVATHDLALGNLVQEYPGHFTNICFEITVNEEAIQYDYKLRSGTAHNLNATWLLERILNRMTI